MMRNPSPSPANSQTQVGLKDHWLDTKVCPGSAHKPWLDAYLSMMSDVELADAERILR